MQGFFNEKLGITFDRVKTATYSDLGNITRPLTPGEKIIVRESIDDIYRDFTGHVAEGRQMSLPEVDSVARGRVWSGQRSEEHTSELQSLMRISYAVFCLKKKKLYTGYRSRG